MKIFISGASGLVGGNCLDYFLQQGEDVVGSYFSFPTPNTVFFDTLHPENPLNFDILAFKPDVIVHCGALTHVDYCETHEEESYEKTVLSTQNLLAIAKTLQAKLVFLSTDYVFDGQEGPYREEDKINPLSIYAKHKYQAEKMVTDANEKNLVIRITNVYGNEVRHKNFVSRIIQMCKQNEPITLILPKDQYATPVNAHDVARAMWLLLKDNHQGVFHVSSSDWMNRVELALRVLKYFPEATYTLDAKETSELNQPAPRPLLGGLIKSKFANLYPEFLFTNVDDFVKAQIDKLPDEEDR